MESLTIPVSVFIATEAWLFAELSGMCIWAAVRMAESVTTANALVMVLDMFIDISFLVRFEFVLAEKNH